jgi:hypothetical protein
MPTSKQNDRTYLRQEERTILQTMLQEWTEQPDKKAKDAFVSGSVVPKIQELNANEYGQDIISINKVARVQWEKRVSVSLRVTDSAFRLTRPILGRIHLVQKSQTLQGPAGFQGRKEDSSQAGSG